MYNHADQPVNQNHGSLSLWNKGALQNECQLPTHQNIHTTEPLDPVPLHEAKLMSGDGKVDAT